MPCFFIEGKNWGNLGAATNIRLLNDIYKKPSHCLSERTKPADQHQRYGNSSSKKEKEKNTTRGIYMQVGKISQKKKQQIKKYLKKKGWGGGNTPHGLGGGTALLFRKKIILARVQYTYVRVPMKEVSIRNSADRSTSCC